MTQGIVAPWSLALLEADNLGSLLWLTGNAQGNGTVVKTTGYTPNRVSTYALENTIGQYPVMSDAVASSYQEHGHPFYVLTFPTGDQTWALDARTGWWAERAYTGTRQPGRIRHRGHSGSRRLRRWCSVGTSIPDLFISSRLRSRPMLMAR